MSTCRPLGPREIPRLLTPSSFTDDAGLRPKRRVSALPISHTPILMGGFISGLTYGSLSLQPVDLLAPLVGADQASTQPTGTCTSGLSTVWSPAPPPDITTETTGQFSLAGLSPLERQLASLQPLIEPDRQISRIRLSEKTHAFAHGRLAVRCGNWTKRYTECRDVSGKRLYAGRLALCLSQSHRRSLRRACRSTAL